MVAYQRAQCGFRRLTKLILRFLQIINLPNIVKVFYCFKDYGLQTSIEKVRNRLDKIIYTDDLYQLWVKRNEPTEKDLEKQKNHKFKYKPVISVIIPIYNTPKQFLIDAINSVLCQTYSNWELCIVDGGSQRQSVKETLKKFCEKDNRIKIKLLSENKGIVGNSNEALSLATGDLIAFVDHDDTLAPFSFYEVIKAVNENPDVDFIYSDEDKILRNGERRLDPHFKPDWSPDTLRSHNYICHLTVIKRDLLNRIGWFRKEYEGSQDYDLVLRASEQAGKIIHIPKILYHWRISGESASANAYAKLYAYESAKKALRDHIIRIGLNGIVEDGLFRGSYKITYPIGLSPKISIIIPNKDQAESLELCVKSVINRSTWKNLDILVVENGSVESRTFKLYDELEKSGNIRIIEWENPFNFSAINNFAVNYVKGEIILFLNNDTEVISQGWLERMLEHILRGEVGAVGAKLYYGNDSIQHAGVVIGLGGVANHPYRCFSKKSFGYMNRLKAIHNLSAVTGACLMTKRDIFEQVGGFDERFAFAFNDIDLCLKMREEGYLVVWTPYAELYHHESKTRGCDDTPEKKERIRREIEYFGSKWKRILEKGDPYYNPNLTLDKEDFSIKI
jgi:GT2 family glycosyltransferase